MWKPNAHRKRLYSEILGRMVQFTVTAYALRCIDKKAGPACHLLPLPCFFMNVLDRLVLCYGVGPVDSPTPP
jgi:hypothetical protein